MNYFSQDVEIVDIVKGGSCSDALFSTKLLRPRERGSLAITWKTGSSRGRHGINVNIIYKLENSEEIYKTLRVEANVVPDIEYEPKDVVFDGTKPEKKSVRLRPARMDRFVVAKARCNHPAFKAHVSGNAVDVIFDCDTPVYANGLSPVLILETDKSK